MDYLDPYNLPQLALRDYLVSGGEVEPDLFHGTIFRVESEESFTLARLANQIDGAKFFLEVYNTSGLDIYITWDSDYIGVNGGIVPATNISALGLLTFEIICRIGKMIVYDQVGSVVVSYLQNPDGGAILINPATGQPLLNPA